MITPKYLDPLSFPLSGTRLIEASAGTGKTYTIAALYLRLVLGHRDETGHPQGPLTPDQILVVTFTKAATEELRDRIRARLVEGASCFRGLDGGDPYLQALKADYPEALHPRCARQLELAAQLMDQAAVHTIHGWCQRMLREHAFDSGALFEQQMEADTSALKEEAVRDYWRTFLYAQGRDTLRTLQGLYAHPDALADAVVPLLGQDALPDNQEDPYALVAQRSQVVQEAKDRCRGLWSEFSDQFLLALEKKWVNSRSIKADHLSLLEDWLQGDEDLPGFSPKVKAYQYFLGGSFHDALTAAGKKQPETLADSPLLKILESLCQALDKLALKPALLCHAARWIARRIETSKARLAQLDFDDLIKHLGQALNPAEPTEAQALQAATLAKRVRHQFPVALIDEFQDTDPTQYGIFQTLYLGQADSALMMIGDPKQAIYAFRGADIHTYLQARRDTGEHLYSLGTNYRSTQAMVDAANSLFCLGESHAKGPFLYGDAIPFEAVKANGKSRHLVVAGEAHPALTLWWDLPEEGVFNKGDYLSRQALACADEIARLLNGAVAGNTGFADDEGKVEPLKAADIAILVRDFSEARAVRQALAANGVRSVYLSDKDSVFASQQAQDLLWLLRAVAAPDSERAIKAALATQTLGWAWATLDGLNQDELAWEGVLETFRTFHHTWQQFGVLALVRQVMEHFDVARRALSDPDGGERRLTNLLHLAELLQQASASLDGELAVIRYLTEQCEGGASGDEQILRLESDAELVKVITIHKSKGLEYPVVFLPFILGFRPAKARDGLLAYRDDEGTPRFTFEAEREQVELADFERLAEDLRLLYVAMTRPSFACYLGLAPVRFANLGKRDAPNVHLGALGTLLGAGQAMETEELHQALAALAEQPGIHLAGLPEPRHERFLGEADTPELTAARTYQGHHFCPWWLASYSALLRGMAQEAVTEPRADQMAEMVQEQQEEESIEVQAEPLEPRANTIHDFPKGAGPGTFLHDLFEWAAEQGHPNGFAVLDDTETQVEIQKRCERKGYEAHAGMLSQWFQQALALPMNLGPEAPAVTLAELDQVQAEMEFCFAAGKVSVAELDRLVTQAVWPGEPRPSLKPQLLNGMLKGFIDLTFCHQGRFSVADYKSNYLGPDETAYTPQAMRDAMLHHRYELQAVLYTLALHRLLKARLPGYDFDQHMGPGLYLFLRGMNPEHPGYGIQTVPVPRSLIERLDALFQGETRLTEVSA